KAAGLTLDELKVVLEERLKATIRFPQVSVTLVAYGPRGNKIYVFGEVLQPGKYDLGVGMTLAEAIAAAGGLTPRADAQHVRVTGQGKLPRILNVERLLFQGDLSQNVELQAGDVIIVPAAEIMVLGAVQKPGRFPLNRDMRVMEALGAAGGTTEQANLRQVVIVHRTGERTTVDLWAFLNQMNLLQNAPLQAGDVVFVPSVAEDLSQGIAVFGLVNQPGIYPYRPGMKVLEALGLAGLSEEEPVDEATLLRGGVPAQTIDLEKLLREGDLSQNLELQPGDRLIVRRVQYRVHVLGQVEQAGTYTVPRGATLVNVLGAAGNFREDADLRRITIIRGAERLQCDFRRLLEEGDLNQDALLQDGDVILVPRLDPRGEIFVLGAVAQPGPHVMREGEDLYTALSLAGGILAQAGTRLEALINRGGKTLRADLHRLFREGDLSQNLPLQRGDVVVVREVVVEFTVVGAVKQPGSYRWEEGMRLFNALTLAGGVEEEADLHRVSILRGAQRFTYDLSAVQEGQIEQNAPVQPKDVVLVPSRGQITVVGMVTAPGRYPLQEEMRVLDALAVAGHTLEKADLRHVQVLRAGSRLIVDLTLIQREGNLAQNVLLQPQDIVFVPAQEPQEVVVVGAVEQPGVYPLTEEMRLLDALALAGHAREDADLRQVQVQRGEQQLTLNVRAVLEEARLDQNVPLQPGDIILVPTAKQGEAAVFGQVERPGMVPVTAESCLLDVLSAAGGAKPEADLGAITVLRGPKRLTYNLERLMTAGDLSQNAPVKPGDVVVVPQAAVRKVLIYGDGVAQPGSYRLPTEATLLDLLTTAGGVTEGADLSRITVTRGTQVIPVDLTRLQAQGDVSVNLTLQSGDRVHIPRRDRVFVLGEVERPGAYLPAEEPTLLDLITAAGGLTEEADFNHIYLYRGEEVFTVDLDAIRRAGRLEANLVIQPGDRIFVPPQEQIMVFGAVQEPGKQTFQPGQSLLDLLVSVGLTENADLSDVALIRRVPGAVEPVIIRANLQRTMREGDASQNPVLQSGDMVFVPPKARRREWNVRTFVDLAWGLDILSRIFRW
ncbi:MAG TPA: hypothetical protein EYP85_12150, partial [Armatimonadetes bacterium]|nr:hypothetical protein [Armatimonadota bacterium]